MPGLGTAGVPQGIPKRQQQQQEADHPGEPLRHMQVVLMQQDAGEHHHAQGTDCPLYPSDAADEQEG